MKEAYLVFENGKIFEGKSFGYEGETIGEAVFTTATTGYMEELTDPANHGKIIVHTFPLLGNCGRILKDEQSGGVWVKGIVCRELCESPSNYRMDGTLREYLLEHKIPFVGDVDTRAITRMLRDYGEMNAQIVFDLKKADPEAIKSYRSVGGVPAVSAGKAEITGAGDKTVVLLDLGVKKAVVEALGKKGLRVVRLPYRASAEEILSYRPSGVVISDGPDRAEELCEVQAEVGKLYGKVALFAMGLGHLVLAAALGGKTERMKFGHRGENQPVKFPNGRTYMTSQNHGECVSEVPACGDADLFNLNDGTVEGIRYRDNAFGVQFQPGGCGGPEDTAFLFDQFVSML